MKRYLVIAAAMTCLATPSQAGLNEGIAAAAAGNYAQAAAEFEPLAAAGDPAGQYYLAKLYLEGHGPSTDVARGVDLMTKAANGNHPEAQAQLGLMYAMGLGVQVDNALAYQWLSKAITALPDGTRRTVAAANRDAVLQRMNAAQRQTAAGTTAPAASADTETATETATDTPTAPAPETTAVTPEPAPAPESAPEVAPAAEPAAQATAEAAEPPAEAAETVVDSEPEQSSSVEVAAAPEPAVTEPASAPATPASADAVKAGIRIQIMSVPNEDAAWSEWNRISKQFAPQLGDLTAVVETADLGTKGIFYRLQAGPFDSLAAAKDRCAKLKEAGLDCLVVGKQ